MRTTITPRRGDQSSLVRKLAFCLGASLLALFGFAALAASSALAVKVHPLESQFLAPGGAAPASLAVNEATHRVYLVTRQSNNTAAVYEFTGAGQPFAGQPELPGFPAEANRVAVDNSAGAFAGYIYVSALTEGIYQFTPSGTLTSVHIDESDLPAAGTPQGGGLPNVVNNGEFTPFEVDVDEAGNIFTYDGANSVIDEFSPAGAFIAQIPFPEPSNGNFAVGPTDEVYFSRPGGGVAEMTAGSQCVDSCAPVEAGAVTASALEVGTTGNLLVSTEKRITSEPSEVFLREFDPARMVVSTSGSEAFNSPGAIALDESAGKLYVADLESNGTRPQSAKNVKIFGPLLTLPDAVTGGASVSHQSAELSGDVGADGGEPATCVFQYVDEATFLKSAYSGAPSVPCEPGGPFSGEALSAVHASLAGLNGGTTYRYRLLATSSAGSTPGATAEFTTEGPSVLTQSVTNIGETSATLQATIDPRGNPTAYRFEYVNQTQFEASGFAEASLVPIPDESIGDGNGAVPVAQPIGGLIPGTGYRFRAVATNEAGERAVGPDSHFVTFAPAQVSLPDSRAYEQASPIDKNGGNIRGSADTVQAAEDGNGITFYANAGLPGAEGGQAFPIFLATRAESPAGWSTQGLLPPAATGPRGLTLGWSSDLKWSFDSNRAAGGKLTIYARENSTHALTEVATGLKGVAGNVLSPAYAGVSEDDSTLFFEDTAKLLTGARNGASNVYAWDRTTGALVLVSVFNTGQAPSEGAFAGPYDWFGSNVSAGGAAAGYYTAVGNALSRDASRVFFTDAGTNQLYVRLNPLDPQSPLDSESHCTDAAAACTIQVSASQATAPDPNGEQPAIFAQASPDGRYVLFMSSGKLTDDANTGPADEGRDLYRFDTDTGELIDLTPDGSDPNGADVQGVLGMSDDGSYVYFAANGALGADGAAGSCRPEAGQCNLYVWHSGTIDSIATLSAKGSPKLSDVPNWLPTGTPVGNRFERSSRVDPSGRVLLFRSDQPLTGYENEGKAELYRYEFATPHGSLQCVSCNPTGAPPTGDASVQALPESFTQPQYQASFLTRNLSTGGSRIFFDSPDKLAANDTNGVNDVYEWQADGTGSCSSATENGGCLRLISSGTSPSPSYFGDASASGNDVFFLTQQALVAQDRDELVDMYDARKDGGIASQNQSEPEPCGKEECAGAATAPATVPAIGTGALTAGNPKPIKCKKGLKKVVKKGRATCVKVNKAKKKHKKPTHRPTRHKRGGSQG